MPTLLIRYIKISRAVTNCSANFRYCYSSIALKEAGFFVSVVNAMLIHDFSDNSIRKIKTDRADSLKIANYALTFWQELRDYSVEDETRQMLKIQSRLYERTLNSSVALVMD